MSLVFRRSYLNVKNNILTSGNAASSFFSRSFSDDKKNNNHQFVSSTILFENGFNVQELPVVVRKLNDLSEIEDKPEAEHSGTTQDSHNFNLIKEEFRQCVDLREVFTLLSKCTKITPNIALGAMERIYDLEKITSAINLDSKTIHISLAKGAILDKLLKVIMRTKDTQTIINILNTESTFMEPYKHNFSDELLIRVIDNKLSVEQLCEFMAFLIKNKTDLKYSDTIDKLWVGFVEREADINESNIAQIFAVLHGFKASKRTILTLLEQKISDIWTKISVSGMQEILNIFVQEKYLSLQSLAVVGRWLNTNIHALDEDSLLYIISTLTRLKYTDDQVEKAVEKYMKLKGFKIEAHVLVVGILNYCMQFQIRNKHILNACSEYILKQGKNVPPSFLKTLIYPYGFLYFDPLRSIEFWTLIEEILEQNFYKMTCDDLCSIIFSYIYVEKHPVKLINRLFSSEYLIKVTNPETLKRLHLIDTALSLECRENFGPLLPKDQWSKPISQDSRIKNIINKIIDCFESVAGGADKLSTAVLVPNIFSDETYLLDVMLHPAGLGSNTYNWKSKSARNEIVAILIHLPDHYCSDNEQLVGPQVMRKKHLKILGMRLVSLKYSLLSQYYTSYNKSGLKQYITDSIQNAEPCT